MLETKPIPSLHPCLTLFEREARRSMSKKQLESTREGLKLDHKAKFTKSPHEVKEHKHGRSSAEDPSIASTRSDKHVSSNSRNHPRAELKPSGSSHSSSKTKHASNHIQNHISGKPHESDGKRKRSNEDEDDVWTEHTSSSGRTYFYNKKLDKSQWERPKGCVKRLKQDSTPSSSQKSKTSSTSSSSSKHTPSTHSHTPSSHSHTPSSHSHTPSSHSHTPSSHSHTPSSHSHTGAGSKESSSHKSHSYRSHRDKEREKSHCSRHHHHHSHQRGSRSRSHSMSVSPSKTVETKHGRERTADKTHSKHGRVGSTHNTPTSSKSTHSSLATSPSVGSTKTSMISPTTPTIPVTFSQTLSATQQIIDQTSILLEHQQKVIGGGDNTTPVQPSTPVVQPFTQPFTSPISTHPHARKELIFTPSNGPYSLDSAASTPVTPVQCYPPVSGIISMTSPQSSSFMDNTGLHPLQKALLLQNQFSQQQQQTQSYVMMDPNTQPGVLMHPPQMPVASPFPPHLNTQQSHPSSPLPQSPHLNPSPAVQVFSAPTPIQQPVPYPMTAPPYLANTSPGVSVNLSFVPVASPTFQTPMSRLGYHTREGNRTADFPDSNSLDPLPPSQTNPELFSKSLAEGWSQFHEGLQKQVDVCSNERLTRQTVECVHLSGRLAKTWLSVEAIKVKTTSKDERIKSLRRLLTDVVQR